MSVRTERVASTIRQSLYKVLLNDIENPLIKNVAITEVTVSPDLLKARIGVRSLTGEHSKAVQALKKATAFIRTRMAGTIRLKKMPELIFAEGTDTDNS